jgi:aryl-alcohol dehydrogenase-like predicted oxidoreductase
MLYRKLGSTNLTVSIIGLGTWQYGGEWGIDYTNPEVAAIVNKAEELGVNFIDTAECYGPHKSEELIGNAIKGNRSRWILATKFGHHFHNNLDKARHFKATDVVKQLEDSLKALQTDYVDIYQCHSATDEEFANTSLWETLHREMEKGKIRHLGISISKNRNMVQTGMATAVKAEVLQVVYNRLDRGPEEEVFPSCKQQNVGVIARVPLASGYLTGKYKPGATFAAADVRSQHNPDDVMKKLKEVEIIAVNEVPAGIPMSQWAIAWCLKNPMVSIAIPGSKNPGQLIQNVKSVDLLTNDHPLAAASPFIG